MNIITRSISLLLIYLVVSFNSFALELPEAEKFEIKNVDDKDILYVVHHEEKGHITNTLIHLIQYYLVNESDDYDVVFPQLSINSNSIDGSYYAIGFIGSPKETSEVKIEKTEGGLFASYIFKGSYQSLGPAIRSVFTKVLKTGNYVPHANEEVRLLYWNSIDDNHPKDLITEIQVRVTKL